MILDIIATSLEVAGAQIFALIFFSSKPSKFGTVLGTLLSVGFVALSQTDYLNPVLSVICLILITFTFHYNEKWSGSVFAGFLSYCYLILIQAIFLPWVSRPSLETNYTIIGLYVNIPVFVIALAIVLLNKRFQINLCYSDLPISFIISGYILSLLSLLFCLKYRPILEQEYHLDLSPTLWFVSIVILSSIIIYRRESYIKAQQLIKTLSRQISTYQERQHDYEKKLRLLSLTALSSDNSCTIQECIEELEEQKKYDMLLPEIQNVIQSYLPILHEKKIAFSLSIDSPMCQVSISQLDAISIYGNLMENAIHACAMLPENERSISFSVFIEHGIMSTRITNTCSVESSAPKTMINSNHFNKANGHGCGLSIASKKVSRYNGELRCVCSKGLFIVQVDYSC